MYNERNQFLIDPAKKNEGFTNTVSFKRPKIALLLKKRERGGGGGKPPPKPHPPPIPSILKQTDPFLLLELTLLSPPLVTQHLELWLSSTLHITCGDFDSFLDRRLEYSVIDFQIPFKYKQKIVFK
uniref:Uncharacterized protein n=1 Tax=Cacopsylla melanoneura TaxID=428564 RepID=A0A8D8UHQ6_9HEMI